MTIVKPSHTFGDLLTQGIYAIRSQSGKSLSVIQDELGYTVNREGKSALEYWRRGYPPGDETTIHTLAQVIATQGKLGRNWLVAFLKSAGCTCPVVGDELPAVTHPVLLTPQQSSAPYASSGLVVGRTELIEEVVTTLQNTDGPWIVSLTGGGGIGKTTVAQKVCAACAATGQFARICWISAQPHPFHPLNSRQPAHEEPALTAADFLRTLAAEILGDTLAGLSTSPKQWFNALQIRLHEQPHLIVIDNLETIADLEMLVPMVRQLTNPTRFLLTSRRVLPGDLEIQHIHVPELASTDALTLLRKTLPTDVGRLTRCLDEQLQRIFTTVGGNPLALRLVVGQSHTHSLERILHALQRAEGRSIEDLYTFIYRYAWDNLSDAGQELFLATLGLPGTGEVLDCLVQISGLSPTMVYNVLQELTIYNLVERHLHDERGILYLIHSLTRTFLECEVLKWQQLQPANPV